MSSENWTFAFKVDLNIAWYNKKISGGKGSLNHQLQISQTNISLRMIKPHNKINQSNKFMCS